VHVALFPLDRLVPSLGDLLARVSAAGPDAMSRALTFITGPSRTADIELKIVVGVHGPKVLHVVLLAGS
jgi:L-lactate dehydrogenase complex protein LldG